MSVLWILRYGGGERGGRRGQEEAHVIGRVHLQLNSEPCGAPAYTYSKHTLVYRTYGPFEQFEHETIPFIVQRNVWFAKQGAYTWHVAANRCTYVYLFIHFLQVRLLLVYIFLLINNSPEKTIHESISNYFPAYQSYLVPIEDCLVSIDIFGHLWAAQQDVNTMLTYYLLPKLL